MERTLNRTYATPRCRGFKPRQRPVGDKSLSEKGVSPIKDWYSKMGAVYSNSPT